MRLRILNYRPDLLNANGDAENARVIARRAEWAGLETQHVERLDESPDIIVIGSGFDAELPLLADALERDAGALHALIAAGVPVLAVGTGFELLCDSVSVSPEVQIAGLGIFAGEVVAAGERIAGDLVVDSPFGPLVGYESHARSVRLGAGVTPLGRVLYGSGNADGSGSEGAIHGSVIGTHLHGPVLARNPALADHLLRAVAGDAYDAAAPRIVATDGLAERAREKLLKRINVAITLGLLALAGGSVVGSQWQNPSPLSSAAAITSREGVAPWMG